MSCSPDLDGADGRRTGDRGYGAGLVKAANAAGVPVKVLVAQSGGAHSFQVSALLM
jgi:hypothetical protein